MIVFYIIRHGETEPNTRSACLGRSDVPLNEAGSAQAEALCERLDGIAAGTVYVSPLIRAYDTISPYTEAHPDSKVCVDERITERDFGEWEDMTFAEIEAADPVRYAQWQRDFVGYAVPGGESSARVQERVNSFIDELEARESGRTVFVVTHLGTARHIISRCLGLSAEQSWRFTLNNASYAVIEYDEKRRCGVLKYLNV